MSGYYAQRVEYLTSGGFDGALYHNHVHNWLRPRHLITLHDRDRQTMFGKNIPGEVREVEAEMNKYGTVMYDRRAATTEAHDVLFFPFAFAVARGISVDHQEIRRSVNGFGNHSHFFDLFVETSGNVSETSIHKDLHHICTLAIALLATLPHKFSQQEIEHVVFSKNSRNYPSEFFSHHHPYLNRILTETEQHEAYVHRRKCLKFIRDFERKTLGLVGKDLGSHDRDYGLLPADYAKYAHLIHNFTHSDHAFATLRIQIYIDHHLTPPAEYFSNN